MHFKALKIKKGDRVEYIDAAFDPRTRKTIKVPKQGIWDGEKVVLEDEEKTIVRNLKWLTKIKK